MKELNLFLGQLLMVMIKIQVKNYMIISLDLVIMALISHSVAYALISYQMAYLKANYLLEFMTVMLSSVLGSEANK